VRKLVLLLTVITLCLGSQFAFAEITADGSVNFDFSKWSSAPAPVMYGWGQNYYGSLEFYNTQDYSRSYPWAPYGQVFLNNNYVGQATYGDNVLNGQWSPTTGDAIGSVVAVSPQNNIQAIAGVNLGGPFRFLGPYTTLPEFSYAYDLKLTKDDVTDYFSGGMQLELGYWTDSTHATEVKLYSDYSSSVPNFRNNWVWLYSGSQDSTMELQEKGVKTFSGYQTLDGNPHEWFIEYGMGMGGADTTAKVVPEPISSVLFLLGAGALTGARKLRRSIKKNS
jgi:hypothetical protein